MIALYSNVIYDSIIQTKSDVSLYFYNSIAYNYAANLKSASIKEYRVLMVDSTINIDTR